MNKINKIGLSLALIFGLTACSSNSGDNNANKDETAPKTTESTQTASTSDSDPLANKDTIKVGVCGEHNEVWDDVIKRYNDKNDKKLELVKFSEYREPNEALVAGDIDINSFQHKKFLKEFNQASGSDVVSIGDTVIAPLGIYSNKIKDIKDLKDGAKVAIPDDPSNSARSLFLLQTAGLIKVNGKDGDNITVDDITDNPKNLDIVELSSSQTARSLDDVDIACINSGMAVDADLIPSKDAIFLEDPKDPDKQIYVNVIATTQANKDSAILKDLVENYYQTDETKKVIEESSKGSEFPAW